MPSKPRPIGNFHYRLQRLRQDTGLTQAELGGRAGLSPSHIAHFESGRRLPSLINFYHLCVALDVTADLLLEVRRAR